MFLDDINFLPKIDKQTSFYDTIHRKPDDLKLGSRKGEVTNMFEELLPDSDSDDSLLHEAREIYRARVGNLDKEKAKKGDKSKWKGKEKAIEIELPEIDDESDSSEIRAVKEQSLREYYTGPYPSRTIIGESSKSKFTDLNKQFSATSISTENIPTLQRYVSL